MCGSIRFQNKLHYFGALHSGPWIWTQYESGIQIQRLQCLHTALIQIRAARQCFGTVSEIQSTGDHTEFGSGIQIQRVRLQCLRGEPLCKIGDPDPANTAAVPMWRAPL